MTFEEQIREASERQLQAKREKEEEALRKKLDSEQELVEQILAKVREGNLYKRTKDSYWNHIKYESITEETFLQDYLSESEKTWHTKGVHLKDSSKPCDGVYEVNGITYYDICWLLNDYEKAIEDVKRRVCDAQKKLREIQSDYEGMRDMIPGIKKMLLDWQEKRKSVAEEG